MGLSLSLNESRRASSRLRRYQRWWRIGSAVMVAAFAIDPDWPIHLRRLVLFLLTFRKD